MMYRKIQIINGPNLNMLGSREPEKYGYSDFGSFLEKLKGFYPDYEFSYFQSNIEGEIVGAIQLAGSNNDAVIINPAGYSHTSVAIADAIAMTRVPVLEVHITNLLSREEFRHQSLTGRYCRGSIMGFGLDGYRLAVEAVKTILER
jgi:3-dehydroquinate dehydratase-2